MLNGIIILSILTILIQATIPFFKKKIFKEIDILVFMLIVNIIIISILIFSCVYKYKWNDFKNQINKLKEKNFVILVLFIGISLYDN